MVNSKHRASETVWADIMNCIRHALKFSQFSDSRWCTLGKCCRQMLHAQLLGLGSLVHAVLQDPDASQYLISGFAQLTAAVQYFLSVAAFASFPAEGLLAELLEDDRVCLHFQTYQVLLGQEMTSLLLLPPLVWEAVTGLCSSEVSPSSLKSQVLSSAHISLGFIESRVWRRCSDWPWKLAIGDIAKNIEELASMPQPPDEPVSLKIWGLANQNCPRELLVEGVGLLQHVGWSSTTVEQIHASATLVKRVHHTYGLQMLTARAFLHTARLFYAVDPLVKEAEKLKLKLQGQLEGTTAIRIPANAMLYKQVMELQQVKGKRKT